MLPCLFTLILQKTNQSESDLYIYIIYLFCLFVYFVHMYVILFGCFLSIKYSISPKLNNRCSWKLNQFPVEDKTIQTLDQLTKNETNTSKI